MNLFDFFKPKTFSHDTNVFTSEIRMVEMLACFSTVISEKERTEMNPGHVITGEVSPLKNTFHNIRKREIKPRC